jgi:hypothetical protein
MLGTECMEMSKGLVINHYLIEVKIRHGSPCWPFVCEKSYYTSHPLNFTWHYEWQREKKKGWGRRDKLQFVLFILYTSSFVRSSWRFSAAINWNSVYCDYLSNLILRWALNKVCSLLLRFFTMPVAQNGIKQGWKSAVSRRWRTQVEEWDGEKMRSNRGTKRKKVPWYVFSTVQCYCHRSKLILISTHFNTSIMLASQRSISI